MKYLYVWKDKDGLVLWQTNRAPNKLELEESDDGKLMIFKRENQKFVFLHRLKWLDIEERHKT